LEHREAEKNACYHPATMSDAPLRPAPIENAVAQPGATDDIFAPYLRHWRLEPDGEPISTRAARLLPVRQGDTALMLKVATHPEEVFGAILLEWRDGEGAARLHFTDGPALVMERAEGTQSLAVFARGGRDDEATEILCDVIGRLHAPRPNQPPDLVPLSVWFRELEPAARTHGGLLVRAHEAMLELLSDPRDVVPLHGDIHHDNVLDFGPRGWLAIDPKHIVGERGFDYANIFCNPDVEDPACRIAVDPVRFARRLDIVAQKSGISRQRLLIWILAWAGLSAAWFISDGVEPAVDFEIASLAAAALDA
jgi:streptomycin 6-kinase